MSNTTEQNYQVFNPGVPAPVELKLTFETLADAAWVEAAVVEAKRDGRLSSLMAGILRTSVIKATTLTVTKNGDWVPPEKLKAERERAEDWPL